MGPQHSYRGLVVALMAFVAFAFLAALTYVPGASRPAEASADTQAGDRGSPQASSAYTLFESGQVRPLSMSPDRQFLFATNTPDRVEIPGTSSAAWRGPDVFRAAALHSSPSTR